MSLPTSDALKFTGKLILYMAFIAQKTVTLLKPLVVPELILIILLLGPKLSEVIRW